MATLLAFVYRIFQAISYWLIDSNILIINFNVNFKLEFPIALLGAAEGGLATTTINPNYTAGIFIAIGRENFDYDSDL